MRRWFLYVQDNDSNMIRFVDSYIFKFMALRKVKWLFKKLGHDILYKIEKE